MVYLLRHRFKLLLATLMTLIVFVPIVLADLASAVGEAGRALAIAFTLWFLLIATMAAGGKRATWVFILALVVPSLLVEIAAAYLWPGKIDVFNHGLRMIFLGFIVAQLLRHLFDPEVVTVDTLCASLCVYLLVGLVWMNLYVIIETLRPGSYLTVVRTEEATTGVIGEADRITRMLYFSFTTLTGVGYGDIVPATHGARIAAVTEALVGQSYLLIMVSRLVGLHVSQALDRRRAAPDEQRNEVQESRP